ncbi:MAG: PorT family protein [Bacteroidales bacterium]|nr:PorT family protein [Bacteroidales bacterium]
MKKILLATAALVLGLTAASAQDREVDLNNLEDLNKIELTPEGKKIEANLNIAFPMYFGTSVLTNVNYKNDWAVTGNLSGFLETNISKNFVYGLDLASIHFKSVDGPLDVSLGLRGTFMDFTFADSNYTLVSVDRTFMPSIIADSSYDGKKSKIHATYLGIPLRVALKFGRAKVYAGASAELLLNGYTKYKHPKFSQQIKSAFNPFRASVEAGFAYGGIGLFVNYSLTPLFPESLSDTRTVSFGLLLGL